MRRPSPTFVGWIPNVAGRLSFGHIGDIEQPRKCRTINVTNGTNRLVICAQRRLCSDTLLAPRYFRWLYNHVAECEFVFAAASVPKGADRIAALEGWVLLVDEMGPKNPERLKVDSLVREALHDHGGARPYESRVTNLHQRLSPVAIASFWIRIERNGVVRIRPCREVFDLRSRDDYASASESISDEELSDLTNQAFYFLRDISHRHSHHHPRSDTVTRAVRGDASFDWAADTHYRIHRKIVGLRRSTRASPLYDALGIMAYISAFKKAAEAELGTLASLSYNKNEIEDALKAKIELAKLKKTQFNLIKTALPALAVAVIAQTRSVDGSISKFIVDSAGALLSNSAAGWGLVIAIAVFSLWYYEVWRILDWPPLVRARRILQPLSKRTQGALWWGLFLLGCTITTIIVVCLPQISLESRLWLSVLAWLVGALLTLFGLPYILTADDVWRKLRPLRFLGASSA